jgi:hypothetical protein
MKHSMIIIWCLLSLACTKTGGDQHTGILTAEALLVNQLPVDGCSWHFSIAHNDTTVRYAADQVSEESLVLPFIQTQQPTYGIYSLKVEISFRLTQKKRDVVCGWNTISNMDEIEIISIRKI